MTGNGKKRREEEKVKDQDKVRRIVPILHWQNVNVQSWCLCYLADQGRNVASRLFAARSTLFAKVVASEAGFKSQVFNLLPE